MNRELNLYYYKYVVKRHLKELRSNIKMQRTMQERRYYIDIYPMQLNIYAIALNVHKRHLERCISNYNLKVELK